MRALRLAVVWALAAGCGAKSTPPPPGPPEGLGETPGVDGPPAERPAGVDPDVSFWIRQGGDEVDLLVMVDNSNSMREEQASLTSCMPDFLFLLANPPDEDGDGTLDQPHAESIHVGVVSSDMGTAGYPVTTCDNSERGDDGVLQNEPSRVFAGCDPSYPRFLTYEASDPDPDIDRDFDCIATLGTGGCGFEQQLAAVEKALTVHSSPGGANEGFLRDESLLAIMVVTDEEDCSVADPRIFGDDDALGPLGMRCLNNRDMQRPVGDLVASVSAVRGGRPDRLVVSGILGVPPDLVELTHDVLASDDLMTAQDFDRILDDERMQFRIDYSPEGGGNRLVPSCNVPGIGIAFPPRRIVEFIRDIDSTGGGGLVQSICQSDWRASMRGTVRLIQQHMKAPSCTSGPLVDASGREVSSGEPLSCALYETRRDASACAAMARIDRGVVDGSRVCQVCQVGDGPGRPTDAFGLDVSACPVSGGWSYEPDAPGCPGGGRIVFAPGAASDADTVVYLECIWPPA